MISNRKRNDKQQQVTFRLPELYAKALAKSGKRIGMSMHAYARHLVIDELADAERHRILDKVTRLETEVARIHEGLATVLANLLVHAGKFSNEESAYQMASKTILG